MLCKFVTSKLRHSFLSEAGDKSYISINVVPNPLTLCANMVVGFTPFTLYNGTMIGSV